jgi:hypothetical protein
VVDSEVGGRGTRENSFLYNFVEWAAEYFGA